MSLRQRQGVLCTVYCVLCTVYCVLCTVYCVLCTVYCVLCTVYCVLCTVYCVLCTVYCVLCVPSKTCTKISRPLFFFNGREIFVHKKGAFFSRPFFFIFHGNDGSGSSIFFFSFP